MTSMTEQIAALDKLSTAELAAEFERLHGRPPRYRSPRWLVKRIAFKLQEAAHGGLTGPVRAELERLASDIEIPAAPHKRSNSDDTTQRPPHQLRLGTVLTRTWHGEQIRAEVTAHGIVHKGEVFKSLSALAKHVTGQHWSGPRFFNLTSRKK